MRLTMDRKKTIGNGLRAKRRIPVACSGLLRSTLAMTFFCDISYKQAKGFSLRASRLLTAVAVLLLCVVAAGAAGAVEDATPATLSLKDALALAEKNNPMLGAARSEAGAADARIGMERAKRRPSLSATTFITDGDMGGVLSGPDSVMPRAYNMFPAKSYLDQNLMLMYPIDVSGRLSEGVRGARMRGAAAAADAERTRQEVRLDVHMAYYRAMYAKDAVGAYAKALEAAEEQLRNDTAMFDAGKVPAYYIDRAKAEVAIERQMLEEAKSAAQIELVRLSSLCGISLGTRIDVTGFDEMDRNEDPDIFLKSIVSDDTMAVEDNPDIKAATQRIAAAEKSLSIARRASAPDMSLALMYDYTDPLDGDTMSGTAAALVVSFPLLDGGMRKSARRENAAMLEAAKREKEAAALRAQADYAVAQIEFFTNVKNLEASGAAITAAEKTYEVVKLRYEAGKGIQVELLDAAAAVTKARLAGSAAMRDLRISIAMMLAIKGSL